MKFQKIEKDFLVFENLGKLSWIMKLEIIWNIHRKPLRKKGTYLLTRARGKFGLWKMAEKIKTCDKRRIDEGHNIVCNVGLKVTFLDVCLRNDDVGSSYSGSVGSSSSSVFTNIIGIFG